MHDRPRSTVADRISGVVKQLRGNDSPLGFGLWDSRTAYNHGQVMNAIKGIGDRRKHIKDGYQYVGGFPAHQWRRATSDDHYKTLSYGIAQFGKEWQPIREALDRPYHYVSIGPGTGEKDQHVLRHLQSMAMTDTIVYVPIDISGDLLRMGLQKSLQDVDEERVEVLPIELDITDAEAAAALDPVLNELTGGSGMLLSLLGNTLANFHADTKMLKQITSLMSPNDLLFIELATAQQADTKLAGKAAEEYAASKSFREFALATLLEYTDLSRDQGSVKPTVQLIDESVIQITTHFSVDKRLRVELKDGDHFDLLKDEPIELYISRKYTDPALDKLFAGFENVATTSSRYRGRLAMKTPFGNTMDLLRPRASSKDKNPEHPVTGGG